MKKINLILNLTLLFWLAQVMATASVPSLNQCPDMIFIDGIEDDSVPSNGSGGAYPGNETRTVYVNSALQNQTYYTFVPSSYQPNVAMPLVFLWHGAGGAGTAPAAAQSMRDLWDSTAEAQQVIIVAQVATGTTGGGYIPDNAADIFAAILADIEGDYNIELSRVYGWGFSAGGHVMHAFALNNAGLFAAYAINAGVLAAYANGVGDTPANATRIIPVFVSVGSSDTLLPYAQTDRVDFIQAGWIEEQNYWLDVFSGGHVLPNNAPQKAWNKICISTNLD